MTTSFSEKDTHEATRTRCRSAAGEIDSTAERAVQRLQKVAQEIAWLVTETTATNPGLYTDAERAEVAALADRQSAKLAWTLDEISTPATIAGYLASKGYTVTPPE